MKKIVKIIVAASFVCSVWFASQHVVNTSHQTKIASEMTTNSTCDPGRPGGC